MSSVLAYTAGKDFVLVFVLRPNSSLFLKLLVSIDYDRVRSFALSDESVRAPPSEIDFAADNNARSAVDATQMHVDGGDVKPIITRMTSEDATTKLASAASHDARLSAARAFEAADSQRRVE